VQGQAADGRPEIEGIAMGVASEAVIDLTGEMDREGSAGRAATAGDRAAAAKLRIVLPGRLEADPVQDLAHADLAAQLVVVDARHDSQAASGLAAAGGFLARWARYDLPRIFSGIAPSTMRSRKAIARGGSPR